MLSQVILLSLLSAVTSAAVPGPPRCKSQKSTICSIQTLTYVDFRLPRLPPLDGKHTLQIRSGHVTRFSKELSGQIAPITKLQLGRLNIESLWIMSTLLHLSAEDNRIDQLIVDTLDNGTYSLQYLNLANNRLRSVRELKDLHQLKELRLEGNQLEYLEMDTFSAMGLLKKLSLSNNQINAVSTIDSIELPSLEFFSLAHNNLTKLAVKNWTMLQLTELELNHNRLVSLDVQNFDQFVSLEKLAIAGNSWYCFWLSKALKKIGRFVTLVGIDADCPAMPIDDICCSMTVVSEDQPVHADIAERLRLFEESQVRMGKELMQKVDRVSLIWDEDFEKIRATAAEKNALAKERIRLSSDDNKVKPEDLTELSNVLTDTEDMLNSLQNLVQKNAQFEKEITKLLYMVIEQKNKLHQTMKNATDLQNEMDGYKASFDASVNKGF